jgi:hypothetical protein
MPDWTRYQGIELEKLTELYQNDKETDINRDDAFLAICFRLRDDLIEKCTIICGKFSLGFDTAVAITELTFDRYGRFKSFNPDKCKTQDLLICFKLYLYRIAKNLVFDHIKTESKRKKGLLYDGSESIVKEMPNIDLESLDADSRIIHKTLMELPYSHRVIYLTYKAYEKNGVNLPRKLLNEMREHLGGIEQGTVRTYKKEAIDKIEQAISIISAMNQSQNG